MVFVPPVLYLRLGKWWPWWANKIELTIIIGNASKFSVISQKQNTERFTHHLHVVGSRCTFILYQLTFWKYEHFHEFKSLCQNGFTNDLHKNEFCSCFMNEAQVVFLLVFLLTYIVGSCSWFWWTWLWKSTDMNSVILMMLHTFLIWCSPWYEMMMDWFLRADESPGPSFINSAYAQMCA